MKQALLPVKPPFSPINTGASRYEIYSTSDVDGRMTANEFAAYTYDAASRITGITQNLWASRTVTQVIGTATTAVTQTYLTPLSWQASYDRRNRVTGFNRDGASTGFSYDANSNRLTSIVKTTSDTDLDVEFDTDDFSLSTSQGSTLGAASNKLLGFSQTITKVRGTRTLATTNSAVNYALDANGNLTSDGLRSFDYDESNRLSKVKITKDGEAASIAYLHNGLGQRVFKGEPTADQVLPNASTLGTTYTDWLKKNFAWMFATAQANTSVGTAFSYADEQLPSWALLGDYDNGSAKGAGRSEYIWLPTEDGSATPVGMYRNSKFFAVHTDHLGTPRLVTNDNNTPVWQWPYSAFGNNKPTGTLKATANPRAALTNVPVLLRATAATEFNLRFPGQYADDEAGNFYNYQRNYLAGQGRFTQADPTGLDGGLSRFAYVDNSPLMFIDPEGLKKKSPPISCDFGKQPYVPDYWRNDTYRQYRQGYYASVCVKTSCESASATGVCTSNDLGGTGKVRQAGPYMSASGQQPSGCQCIAWALELREGLRPPNGALDKMNMLLQTLGVGSYQ